MSLPQPANSRQRSIEPIVLARALAIGLVVANHAVFGVSLHGGLNALLVISGLSMAQFGFSGGTGHALRAFLRFGLRLAVPSFLIALIWGMGVGKIDLYELGFISNWMHKSRVALFPIWYTQAVTQLLIALGILFYATDMGARIQRDRLSWISGLYLLACAVALASYALWDNTYLADKVPHLIAWNFAFGWLIWAVKTSRFDRLAGQALLTAVLLVSVWLIFLETNADSGAVRAIFMPLIVLPLIWLRRIYLPAALLRPVALTSQATLFIFLFHYYFFWAAWRIGRMLGFENEATNPWLRLAVGLGGPIVLWLLWTATVRVFRRSYRLPEIGLLKRPSEAALQQSLR